MMNNTASATSNVESLSEDLATSLGIGIVQSILILSWFFAPLPFGFWAGLSLPGNNLKRYILLGLLVGLLSMVGVIGAHMLFVGAVVAFRELVAADLRHWMEQLAFDFIGPALFFIAGGLFADVLKTRAYQKSIDLGLPEQMVAKLSGSKPESREKDPAQRKSLLRLLRRPTLILVLGTLIRFALQFIPFVENFFI